MIFVVRRPTIDKSRIKKELWEDKHVVRAEKWLQDEIMRPGHFDTICEHEGAHLFYVRQIYPEATICPPSVAFFKGAVRPIEAGIETTGINKCCDRNRLLTFVKALRAGEVAEVMRLLELSSGRDLLELLKEIGDEDDRENYPEHCENIRNASPGLEFDNDEIWTEACTALVNDFLTPEIKAEIAATTEEVRSFLQAAMYSDSASSVSVNDDSSTHSKN
jgi:hypothetical protein